MRIAIDMVLAEQQPGGMFFATCALLEGLARIDTDNEYFIITSRPEEYAALQACAQAPNMYLYPLHFLFRRGMLIQHHTRVTHALHRIRPDVLHVPAFAAPIGWHGPLVQTVHDLSFLKMPWQASLYAHLYWRYCLQESVQRARRIIAVSEQTREELITCWSVSQERIHLVHNALRLSLRTEITPQEIHAIRARIGGRYILHVGRIIPRKNVETLLEAFDLLAERHADLRLVLAGGNGYGSDEVLRRVSLSPHRARIHLPGWVPEEEMGVLYAGASMLVFPSLHEGFGLPTLEAMACGTPVVASPEAASQEIAAEAVLRVDCSQAQSLKAAIARLLGDTALRERLVQLGHQQVQRFSCTACGRQTLRVYHLAAGVRG
ncbi:MAG: glycosyltransferase family 4 protein [Ktedonobacteraceae bacterium]|nr:glycosyltransferase family 4 protein [Ktedonobacteraceae bacterium]MBO0790518.1 glycosyltransferase family 4 protein [Ktedonobacteraceae bacterium]